MRFYEELILSDKIKMTKEEIIDKIKSGDTFYHTYLIVVPLTDAENQIEYFHLEISKQEYFCDEDYMVVGIALGKANAKEMVCQIIQSVYEETQMVDVKKYFIDKSKGMERLC